MSANKVAYVIVGWNNRQLLEDCFRTIQEQTYPEKLIVYVDNESSDNSVAWVRENYPKIRVIAQGKNTGFTGGNNVGIEEVLKDKNVGYIALVNTDSRLEPDWTEKIVDFAKTKPNGACFQGTTLDYGNHGIIDSTHIYISRNGRGTQGSWRYYYTGEFGPKKVFGVNAAACIISRNFIEAQPFKDFFDESLFMYLEDIDLAARSTILGWDNYLVPGAKAYHMGSVSASSKSSTYSLYMTFRNNSSVLFKNLPLGMLIRMTPKIIRGDIDTIRTLWRRKQKASIWQVVKGRAVGLARLPLFAAKGYKMRRHRKLDSDYLWLLMKDGY